MVTKREDYNREPTGQLFHLRRHLTPAEDQITVSLDTDMQLLGRVFIGKVARENRLREILMHHVPLRQGDHQVCIRWMQGKMNELVAEDCLGKDMRKMHDDFESAAGVGRVFGDKYRGTGLYRGWRRSDRVPVLDLVRGGER